MIGDGFGVQQHVEMTCGGGVQRCVKACEGVQHNMGRLHAALFPLMVVVSGKWWGRRRRVAAQMEL